MQRFNLNFSFPGVLVFVGLIALFAASCSNTPSRPDPAMTPEQHERVNAESAALEAQRALNASTGVAVQHYTCPNNCPGSGGDAQGTCPVCGNAYVHNAAYHNQTSPTSTPTVTPTNAAGVYHYTCPNGCAGGAGAMGTCATCGATLAHNQAYHN